MITVIMAVYNGARFMDKAIASVVAQTSPQWELLIVDDGSTDDSLDRASHWRELVNSHYSEEKIRVYSTGNSNSGPQVGRNIGAERARYDIFAYLDQDDLFFPRRIESIIPFFNEYDLVFAPYEIFEKERVNIWNIHAIWNKQSYVCSSEGERDPTFDNWIHRFLGLVEISVPLGAAHTRDIFNKAGGFQPQIVSGASGVLWRRMAERGARIGYCPVIAGRYNVRPDSQARTKRRFSIGGFELQKDHPLGSNGQYLDEDWFAALELKNR